MEWTFEQVAGPFGATTEGPAWDGRFLYFTVLAKSLVMRYDPESGACIEWRTNSDRTNGMMFDAQGKLYGCSVARQAIVRFEDNSKVTTIADRLNGTRINTPNDLAIDRRGRIWFSNPWNEGITLPEQRREMQDEFILRTDPEPDGSWSVRAVASDTSVPNGVLLSPDERTLYVSQCDYGVDKPRELRAYPINDDGSLGDFTVLHTFGKDHRGVHRAVDGMCCDADGNIIAAAGWGQSGPGPMIYVFTPSGRILETHPCEQPSNCTFGDRDLQTLYVTTFGRTPSTGKLFRIRPNRKGWNLFP